MKVAVLGAGAMGTGIGQIAVQNGCHVVYYDSFPGATDRSKASIEKIFNRLAEKGKITSEQKEEMLGRMQWSADVDAVSGADLVVEAVIEDLDVKKDLFAKVEPLLRSDAWLCTNTSSLSIAALSSGLTHPERFGGLHFFNPAPLMPLVEVVPGVKTGDDFTETMEALMLEWGKVPVVAKDTPGFIVNKVARPFYSEAIKLYEEGVASIAEIDAAVKSIGFRMGPFELTDLIGHDVNYTVTETVWSQFFYDPRFRPSITQKRLKEAGLFGRKTGRGFYNYASGMDAAVVAQEEVEIDPMLSEKIVERILCLIINEALDAVWQGIASPENVDLAMTKGVNYPKGPIQWGREMGWDQVLGTLKRCHKHYGDDRYRPCPLLRHLNTGNAELGEGQLTDNFMV
ncbi:MAG: 3-hydroxyacyl-CoA dehydrogenase NAD-binding domain-containing protein [Schleiferiaceae bacterium]|nr:3-hydroxyacyl-CoA dehydrogenase NAD-binding domain-containing protein [Schleiferiaceae bacterium]MDP4759375.1 3-hydroxyacyl-CoA dehydrogenase NAD-binding domain-containing protein [Schleiferiaceae bacterium]MDP4767964.1 3-hydroxyacyl-CoA dehydrogenase NAD-binding domain-containing protein [Schleiferiaceae bacterium]MDP4958856.1 3-hydroxyacyl-CoA dehydrogenase NAD-binding domain-containing protein [Schleiferiaceae bacterium]